MTLERLNVVRLCAVSLFLSYTGCTQFGEPLVLTGSPTTHEGTRQAPLLAKNSERSPNRTPSTRAPVHLVKSQAETRIDAQPSDNAAGVLEIREAGQTLTTSREVVEVAKAENSTAAFLPGPAEAHALTGAEEEPSVAWSGGFVLALAATLLLCAWLLRKRARHNTPTTPLVKLLHTRPWR